MTNVILFVADTVLVPSETATLSVVLLVILQEYVYVNVPPLATPLIIVVNRIEPSYTLID